jgi:GrpB-like predicted nucleotidyltransferase (UPF0157 family)
MSKETTSNMPEPNESVLGVPRTDVRLAPYDPRWVELYGVAVSELRDCLGRRMTAVEHIGSTAIPGLTAKPIIDIMAGVSTFDLSKEIIADLQGIGYEHRNSDTVLGRLFFAKGSESNRTHNLSVCEAGSQFWLGRVAFRDALRTNKEWAQQYAALKQRLAQQYPHNRLAYTEAKEPFILSVVANAQAGAR